MKKTLAQTVLPFKHEITQDQITAYAGLVLFGEFLRLDKIPSSDAVGDWLCRSVGPTADLRGRDSICDAR